MNKVCKIVNNIESLKTFTRYQNAFVQCKTIRTYFKRIRVIGCKPFKVNLICETHWSMFYKVENISYFIFSSWVVPRNYFVPAFCSGRFLTFIARRRYKNERLYVCIGRFFWRSIMRSSLKIWFFLLDYTSGKEWCNNEWLQNTQMWWN